MLKKLFQGIFTPSVPKFSLERLSQLYAQLNRNQTITENNSDLVIETLRAIAELMIWGDQHNPEFFEFFLEKNIWSYILNVLKQKCGTQVKKQVMQTLSIMIQNINEKSSLYFLMSNNHLNELITHKFEFAEDEELFAYYITFLKTISLKLDKAVVQFFFNAERKYFPLYTESIKYFAHEESMVRIAVRTISLQIYSVADGPMIDFILKETAESYFTELLTFMRGQFISLEAALQKTREGTLSIGNVEDSVAELLDNVYYLNDIFNSKQPAISDLLGKITTSILLDPFLIKSVLTNLESEMFEEAPITPPAPRRNSQTVPPEIPAEVVENKENQETASQVEQPAQEGTEASTTVTTEPQSVEEAPVSAEPVTESVVDPVQEAPKKRKRVLLSPAAAMFFLAHIYLVYSDPNILQHLTFSLFAPESLNEEKSPNPYRKAILDSLASSDEALVAAASSLVYTVLINKGIPKELLDEIELAPRKLRKTQRLFESLLEAPTKKTEESDNIRVSLAEKQGSTSSLSIGVNIEPEKLTPRKLSSGLQYPNFEVEYPYDIVDILLTCLEEARPRKLTTYHVILRLLSAALSPQKEDPAKLSIKHQEKLTTAITQALQKAKQVNAQQFKEFNNMITFWEAEYNQIKQIQANKIELFLADPGFLINETNEDLQYDLEYFRRVPTSPVENAKSDVHIFLLLREFHTQVHGQTPAFIDSILLTTPRFTLKQQIIMNNREVFRCNIFERTQHGQASVPRYIFFEYDHLYIVSVNLSKMGYANIRQAVPLLFTYTKENPENRYTLFMVAERKDVRGNNVKIFDEILVFDDSIKCKEVRGIIEKKIAQTKQLKTTLFEKLLSLDILPVDPTNGEVIVGAAPAAGNNTSGLLISGRASMSRPASTNLSSSAPASAFFSSAKTSAEVPTTSII